MDVLECRGLCPSCLKKVGEEKEFCPECQGLLGAENLPHQLAVGSALGGKYYVGRVIEEAAQSITYIGLDLTKNQRVMIKEFYPAGSALRQADRYTVVPDENANGAYSEYSFDNAKAYFTERIKNLAFFRRCKGVVAFLEDFEENGTVYKVMEFEEGVTLSRVYEQRGAAIPADELLMLLEPVFMAVNAFNEAHIVHGGIDPDHIIVTQEGGMLLDFADEVTHREAEMQKSSYFAPEQIIDAYFSVDSWTDIYSLAAVFYRGITGRPPLGAKSRADWDNMQVPTELNRQVNIKTENAVLKGLSVDPGKRYRKASQFYDDLVGAVAEPSRTGTRPRFL